MSPKFCNIPFTWFLYNEIVLLFKFWTCQSKYLSKLFLIIPLANSISSNKVFTSFIFMALSFMSQVCSFPLTFWYSILALGSLFII